LKVSREDGPRHNQNKIEEAGNPLPASSVKE
jgi:hypothetical protein